MATTRGRRSLTCRVLRSTTLVTLAALAACAAADDWPTFRHDNARSGCTADAVAPPLHLRWAFRQAYPPQRVWSGPRDEAVEGNWEKDRVAFDAANQVAVVGDSVFMASSGDSKLYCLDAQTGAVRWALHRRRPGAPGPGGGRRPRVLRGR